MTQNTNEGRDALKKLPSRVPWKTVLKVAPWLLWGTVALVIALKMDVITTEDLRLIAEIFKSVTGPSS